jgi:hypothetical protein
LPKSSRTLTTPLLTLTQSDYVEPLMVQMHPFRSALAIERAKADIEQSVLKAVT